MKRASIVLLAMLATLSSGFGPWSCSRETASVTVAYSPFESTALLWIAADRGLFSRNGLDVTPLQYTTGVGALDGMLQGEADLALGSNEFPLVGRALKGESIRTVGSIARSEFIYIVGRKDRGIEVASDLRGKRIGTTFRTIAEFYLGRFLELNGMSLQDITMVDLKTPAEWVDAVVNGDVDAVSTAQPYARSARDALGGNAVAWSAQSSQPLYTQVIATNEWIAGRHDVIVRFLKSLAQAEEYLVRHPAEAKAIVQNRLDLDAAYMETVWSQNEFGLSLGLSLILAMEDEARWLIANNLTTATQVPNFLDYIYEDGLKAVKPGAVNIVR